MSTSIVKASTFEERKQEYIYDVMYGTWGQEEPYQRNSLWAYFMQDSLTAELKERIHVIVRAMVLGYEEVMPELGNDDTVGFFKSVNIDNSIIFRVLLQFKNKITAEDYNWILDEIQKQVIDDNGWLIASNGNQRIQQLVGLYLWGEQFDPNATITYWREPHMGDQWENFTYNGNSYVKGPGNRYNAYQFARDCLLYNFDNWINTRKFISSKGPWDLWEFDSGYSHSYITALATLYDLAKDPVMKKKAQMMLDFYILDYYLDYSALEHGGGEGRSGGPGRVNYDWILFGFDRAMHPAYPSRDFFVTTYKLPEIILDLIDLSDEPDSYYHIHKEYNPRLHEPGRGKKTFVTKYFNIGGGFDWSWELNIYCGKPGRPTATMSINDKPIGGTEWWKGGEYYQYRNALNSTGANLQCNAWSYFDRDETVEKWRFLKMGKTMIATSGGWIEVCVEGADYATFDDFKAAVLANSIPGHQTSKGIQVTRDYETKKVYASGNLVDDYPFKRMETVDNQGNILVNWQDNVMTLSKHGRTRVYDFNNWTIYDASQDNVPPGSPLNLRATNIAENSLKLEWDPPQAASEGDEAVRYVVYRDNIMLGFTTDTFYSDAGLSGGHVYEYNVYSFDLAGNRSTNSAQIQVTTLTDQNPPEVVELAPISKDHIKIVFNENVDQTSAETTGNYSITPDLVIQSATLSGDGRTVILVTSILQANQQYTVTITNIKDLEQPPNVISQPIVKTFTFYKMFYISDLTPANYDTARIKVWDQYYIDRTYEIRSIPTELQGLLWIRTANDDKESTNPEAVVFTISDPATIFIGYDQSISVIPSWLSTWTNTGKVIETNDTNFQLYSKRFDAGRVVLGGNEGAGSSSMYLILINHTNLDLEPPSPPQGIVVKNHPGY